MNKWKNVPLGINSIALGTMGIATSLSFLSTEFFERFFATQTTINNLNYFLLAVYILCIFICLFYLFFVISKYLILKFQHLPDEFNKPTMVGSIGVTLLCLCIISNSIGWIITTFVIDPNTRYYSLIFPNILVFLANVFQLIYMFLFFKKYILGKNWTKEKAYGSWFVPLVGIGISAAYADHLGDVLPIWYWQSIWFLSFLSFLFTSPIFLYRFLFKPHTDTKHIPSMAIYSSPANMLGLGFLVAFNPDRGKELQSNFLNNEYCYQVVSIFLFCWSILGVLIYAVIFVKSMKIKNYWFTYGALTFPASVSASGTAYFARYLFLEHFTAIYWFLYIVAIILFFMSLYVVIYLNFKYMKLLTQIFKKKF
ncbi:hypothetical protein [Mycoplasma buteonis]|uniref:SLAC1 family transporter n=1 Tax=Mycoplasma buteonis TaxID=171280 RepID=UPI0012EC42A1|nr:hypothetical protein [Mycoplasma buteonis]